MAQYSRFIVYAVVGIKVKIMSAEISTAAADGVAPQQTVELDVHVTIAFLI